MATAGIVRPMLARVEPSARFKLVRNRLARIAQGGEAFGQQHHGSNGYAHHGHGCACRDYGGFNGRCQ